MENVISAGNGAFEGLEPSAYLPHLLTRPPEESAPAFTPLLTPFLPRCPLHSAPHPLREGSWCSHCPTPSCEFPPCTPHAQLPLVLLVHGTCNAAMRSGAPSRSLGTPAESWLCCRHVA